MCTNWSSSHDLELLRLTAINIFILHTHFLFCLTRRRGPKVIDPLRSQCSNVVVVKWPKTITLEEIGSIWKSTWQKSQWCRYNITVERWGEDCVNISGDSVPSLHVLWISWIHGFGNLVIPPVQILIKEVSLAILSPDEDIIQLFDKLWKSQGVDRLRREKTLSIKNPILPTWNR